MVSDANLDAGIDVDTAMGAEPRDSPVPWQEVFGHDSPYPEQEDGIEAAVDTARDGGFTVVEGACGTGKTMLALTAGLHLVRDPESRFERVLVLTSVKQQLRQFEDDIRTITANLSEEWRPFSALTLVGKADVCPYARERTAGIDSTTVYDRCEGLRERTRNLTGEGGDTTAGALVQRAREAQTGLADSSSGGVRYLETAGEPTPYLPETPEYADTEYCPFYARYLDELPDDADGDAVEAVPFSFEERGLIDSEELVGLAASWGSCPHSVMGALLPHVECVVGNYYHAFDPTTASQFTGALLDESTFVVCDEAHMLESRVRELVSDGVGDRTLRDAASELTRVLQPVQFDDAGHAATDAETIRAELAESDVTVDEIREVRDAVEALRDELSRRVESHLDHTRPDWRASMSELDDAEIPLRDPTTPEEDELTEWAREAGHLPAWSRAHVVGSVVAHLLDTVEEEDGTRAVSAVGRALTAWASRDHERYFRLLDLERTWDSTEPAESWRRAFNARLTLHNCLPGDAIAETLAEFGGGVLMSATLEPLDVFRRVTGLDSLADADRPVTERTYGLGFPESNRESFAVDAPKYTYDNRGPVGSDSVTREVYVDAVVDVARSPGNVLVGMPNYGEASWMADRLADCIEKPVLLDESSADAVTETLKDEFFAGDAKVLVTSLRGTLTEGVDYRGDRLSAAVVCGVPIVDTSSPKTQAVRAAYDRAFGGDAETARSGFETALLVPAVRKARQALGRVIRGADERGVRVLVDERYARDGWDSVREHLPPQERAEFRPVSTDMLSLGVERFWN